MRPAKMILCVLGISALVTGGMNMIGVGAPLPSADFNELVGYSDTEYQGERKKVDLTYSEPQNTVSYSFTDPGEAAARYSLESRGPEQDDGKDIPLGGEVAEVRSSGSIGAGSMDAYRLKSDARSDVEYGQPEGRDMMDMHYTLLGSSVGRHPALAQVEKVIRRSPSADYPVDSYASLIGDLDGLFGDRRCTWTRTISSTDSNGDSHPEHARLQAAGDCQEDRDSDGTPEWTFRIGIDAEVYDNASDGRFDVLLAALGAKETSDVDDDGMPEHTAIGGWKGIVRDDVVNDGNMDEVTLTLRVKQDIDRDQDGIIEFVRYTEARVHAEDTTSDSHPEMVALDASVDEMFDDGDDGSYEYEMHASLGLLAHDAGSLGEVSDAHLSLKAYDTYDEDMDARPEVTRMLLVDIDANDTTGDMLADTITGRAAGTVLIDSNSNGVLDAGIGLLIRLDAGDSDRDGAPEYVRASLQVSETLDRNEDGTPEKAVRVYIAAHAEDANSNGVFEGGRASGVAWAGKDADSSGKFEYEAGMRESYSFTDMNDDGFPETVSWSRTAAERSDPNEDGVYETERVFHKDATFTDANSNGIFERVDAHSAYYGASDVDSDGYAESLYIKIVDYTGEDPDEDGFTDSETISVWEYRRG